MAKVGTSNQDRTISLKMLQCLVENNNNSTDQNVKERVFCDYLCGKKYLDGTEREGELILSAKYINKKQCFVVPPLE